MRPLFGPRFRAAARLVRTVVRSAAFSLFFSFSTGSMGGSRLPCSLRMIESHARRAIVSRRRCVWDDQRYVAFRDVLSRGRIYLASRSSVRGAGVGRAGCFVGQHRHGPLLVLRCPRAGGGQQAAAAPLGNLGHRGASKRSNAETRPTRDSKAITASNSSHTTATRVVLIRTTPEGIRGCPRPRRRGAGDNRRAMAPPSPPQLTRAANLRGRRDPRDDPRRDPPPPSSSARCCPGLPGRASPRPHRRTTSRRSRRRASTRCGCRWATGCTSRTGRTRDAATARSTT